MSVSPVIPTDEFLAIVTPALAGGDVEQLKRAVCACWRPSEVASLLGHGDACFRRAVAVTLAVVGDRRCIRRLVRALHDEDWRVHDAAEHALWSIWFRSGNAKSAIPFGQGLTHLEQHGYPNAVKCFHRAAELDPTFAEAYNQRAIAHTLNCQYREALEAGRCAADRMPYHFGALAGMGHSHVELGEIEQAVACYLRALRINPRMSAVAETLDRLQTALQQRLHSSGAFDCDFSLA